jgi:hypothetical protein
MAQNESEVTGAQEQQEVALSEMTAKYPNRWVAIVVTKRDRNFQPLAGKVVADDVDRYRLRQKIIAYKDICILFAGENAYPLLL